MPKQIARLNHLSAAMVERLDRYAGQMKQQVADENGQIKGKVALAIKAEEVKSEDGDQVELKYRLAASFGDVDASDAGMAITSQLSMDDAEAEAELDEQVSAKPATPSRKRAAAQPVSDTTQHLAA